MKKVLIALDYDPSVQMIAESGYSLAKTMNAKVVLLHVIAEPEYYSTLEYSPLVGFTGFMNLGPIQSNITGELKKASLDFLDKIKNHVKDTSIQTLVKEGDFAQSILLTAKEVHADIIVMGSHSRKWLENIVMGSVTENVLNDTTIPLYIVPTRKQRK